MSESPESPMVLLVDDDSVLRMLAVEALEGAGFTVVEAAGAEEGLAAFAARAPDLVLLDLLMPGLDGYEVCRRIRRSPSGASLPIMVMTGLDDTPSIDLAFDSGATDFVTKPINYGLLAHRLRYLLRSATAFRQARAVSRRLGRAQQLARLAQWELDLSSQQIRWSEEASAIFGLSVEPTSAGACTLLSLVHPDDRRRVEAAFAVGQAHSIEYRLVLPDGSERIVRQDAELVEDAETGARLLSGAAQDVTELRLAERKARDLAYFDVLTGLPNRSLLSSFLGHALDDARRDGSSLAILSLDLDGFKRVNDTLGHAAGDVLLKEVARRVSSCIRSTDVVGRGEVGAIERQLTADSIACRLGGDEFVVALTRVGSRDNAALVAQRIADRLASPFHIAGNEVFISSSIGIASFPDCDVGVEILLEHADAAMYHAKERGRNQYQFFSSAIQERTRKRLVVENALRAALERSGIHRRSLSTAVVNPAACEFRLEYQPKVEIPSGRVLGAEALLRWTSPELGPVSPVDFICVAEETGLIVPLGAWVLDQACTQAQAWAAERPGGALRVAVNVSARQFRDPTFPELVAHTLKRTGLAPGSLELEITEGMLMQDTVGSSRVLAELKALGVRIALDDFGTGYSSLSYLTKLPIDVIKIDRSFVRDLDETVKSATITSAIIGLSRGLDIDVVVEGVETQAQLDFVAKHGSSEIQGYLFAKPMCAHRLEQWRAARDAGMGPVPSARPIEDAA